MISRDIRRVVVSLGVPRTTPLLEFVGVSDDAAGNMAASFGEMNTSECDKA
jgi:hypothetical protein